MNTTAAQGITTRYFIEEKEERLFATQLLHKLQRRGQDFSSLLKRIYKKSIFHDFIDVFTAPVQ